MSGMISLPFCVHLRIYAPPGKSQRSERREAPQEEWQKLLSRAEIENEQQRTLKKILSQLVWLSGANE
jgi:tRNA C32,U32 (ribose-2'-O)-methylase TrmJ